MGRQLKAVDINPVHILEAAYDGSDNMIYLGKAIPGTATATAAWQIRKMTYDGSDNLTVIELADGNDDFDNIWDNRAALSYS